MNSCRTTKNPCKICFRTVTKRTGIQCEGACKKWVHFQCLNFTPGKIRDIKAGIIKVMCPCPDCSSTEPKEILANPPYTCRNIRCPANSMPICESLKCPAGNPPKGCDKKECSKNMCDEYETPPSLPPLPKLGPPAPAVYAPAYERYSPGPPDLYQQSLCQHSIGKSKSCCCVSKATSPPPPISFGSPYNTYNEGSSSDSRLYQPSNPRRASNPSMECALEQMCKTVNVLTKQIQELLTKFSN